MMRLALRSIRTLGTVLFLWLGLGCVTREDMERLHEADRLTRSTISALANSDASGIVQYLKPESAKDPRLAPEVAKMRRALPDGIADTVRLVTAHVTTDHPTRKTTLTYVVRRGQDSARVDVWVNQGEGFSYVETLRVARMQ
jgi:hypothetical protein